MARNKVPALAPINAGFPAAEQWIAAQPSAAGFLLQDAAWSPTFSEQSFNPGQSEVHELWSTGADVSWLGGPALQPLPSWPRTAAGRPLAHVMTIALADPERAAQSEDKNAWPQHAEGLPATGALEVFHDLRTFGWEASDRDQQAWLVRWVSEPERSTFAAPPQDLDLPGPACQAGLFLPGWTLRSAEDLLNAPEEQFEAAEAISSAVRQAWAIQRGLPQNGYPIPVTHLYGHAQHASAAALRVLGEAVPLEQGDSYRLVLEIESWTHLNGWFGDAGTLQVWMRASDLAAQRFSQAWCMIRTD